MKTLYKIIIGVSIPSVLFGIFVLLIAINVSHQLENTERWMVELEPHLDLTEDQLELQLRDEDLKDLVLYRVKTLDYYFDDTSLPSSDSFDFPLMHTINACTSQSVCFGEFENGTKIRISCDYPIHGCGVKSFDGYKQEDEN